MDGGLLAEVLGWVIGAGWVIIVLMGIEADRPLSGGIPGHVDVTEGRVDPPEEGLAGRVGTVAGWVLFGAASLSLPFIVAWIG
jgi:hypothetical protein